MQNSALAVTINSTSIQWTYQWRDGQAELARVLTEYKNGAYMI